MKVAIINITAGGMSGGYKKYLEHLLPRMSSHPAMEKILCALPSSVSLNVDAGRYRNIEFISIAPYRFAGKNSYADIRNHLGVYQPDVVYVPVERPFPYDHAPVVTMLQNMEPFVVPFSGNPLLEKLKNWFRYRTARTALIKADRIIAISRFVENYLTLRLHIHSSKIGLVYHGIDRPSGTLKRPAALPEQCKEFVFTAGSIRPARGLEDIFSAMEYLSAQKIELPTVVISGNTDPLMARYQNRLVRYSEKYCFAKNIIWTGTLQDSEMAWCYHHCSAFVTTSRVEACSNIVLESMANGCINISTDVSPMPELYRETAMYYPQKNGQKLGESIRSVLEWSTGERAKVSEQTRKRALEFSWDLCAEKTIKELETAMRDFVYPRRGIQ